MACLLRQAVAGKQDAKRHCGDDNDDTLPRRKPMRSGSADLLPPTADSRSLLFVPTDGLRPNSLTTLVQTAVTHRNPYDGLTTDD